MSVESRTRGAHGCTVLVSTFCGNELFRRAVCQGKFAIAWSQLPAPRRRALSRGPITSP